MSDWIIWQWIDSAFPSGSFAHSGGLEAAWQHKVVVDSQTLAEFVISGLRQAARFSLPAVLEAARSPAAFTSVDQAYHSLLNNHVANRASRLQGRALASASARAFDRPALHEIERLTRVRSVAAHQAPVFGAVAAALGLSPMRAGELFAFQLLRGWMAAAVRLGVIGPLEGQSLQAQLLPPVTRAVESAAEYPFDQIAQVSPFLDMLHANHDRLYSRLFQS